MAGTARPDAANLASEASFTVLSVLGSQGAGGDISSCGLFDGTTVNEWNTARVMYWMNSSNYLEVIIHARLANIWRCGTTNWANSNNPLTIQKWDGEQYVDVTSEYSQTLTKITETQWEKTINGLPGGMYKFIGGNGYRLDSEWYIEDVTESRFLIKQLNQNPQSLVAGQFINVTLPLTDQVFKDEGIEDISALFTPTTQVVFPLTYDSDMGTGKLYRANIDVTKYKSIQSMVHL